MPPLGICSEPLLSPAPRIIHILPFPDSSPVIRKSGDDELCERSLAQVEETVLKALKIPLPDRSDYH
jgi:hypothetical protein